MVAYAAWFRTLGRMLDAVIATRTSLVLCLVTLLLAPIILIVMGGRL